MRISLFFTYLSIFVITSACSKYYYEYTLCNDFIYVENSSIVKLKNNRCYKVVYSHYEYIYNDSIFFLDTIAPEKIPLPIDSIYHKKSKSEILFKIRKKGDYVYYRNVDGKETSLPLIKGHSTVVNSIPYFGLLPTHYKTLNSIISYLNRDFQGQFKYDGIASVESYLHKKIDYHKYTFTFEKPNFIDFPQVELYLELNTFFPILFVFEERSFSDYKNNYYTVKLWNSPHKF